MISLLPLFISLAAATWIYFSLWFVISQHFKRLDLLDSAWGLGFVYVAVLTLFISNNFGFIPVLSTFFVSVWGVRLFWHITSRNIKKDEDARYKIYRGKWQKNFAMNAYFRLFMTQAVLLLVISLASVGAIIGDNFIAAFAGIGFLVWAFGIIFEAVSDWQLQQFITKRKTKDAIMDKGLWKYSRHPNYFGEIMVWAGAGLVALSAGNWWGLAGSVTIAFLIVKVSGVPLLEKKYAGNPNFDKYKQKTSVLIPLPPKT